MRHLREEIFAKLSAVSKECDNAANPSEKVVKICTKVNEIMNTMADYGYGNMEGHGLADIHGR